jgi:hypothetical protein
VQEVSHCSGSPESVFSNTISNPPRRFLCSQEVAEIDEKPRSNYHKQLIDKITVWEDQDIMELTCLKCTLPNCKPWGWVTPFMMQEDAVLALKHHKLTYHTVPNTMMEEERKHSQEGRLGMIIMECEACGYSTQGYERDRVLKFMPLTGGSGLARDWGLSTAWVSLVEVEVP